MAFKPPPYQLFHVRPSSAQRSMDAFVSAFWHRRFHGQPIGPNYRFDQISFWMYHQPEHAALQLCPYYFDQVSYSLPTREQVRQTENRNLRIHLFDSWANSEQEKKRAAEQELRRHPTANPDPRFNTGLYLSGLHHLKDPNTGRSLSTKQYLNLMYGSTL